MTTLERCEEGGGGRMAGRFGGAISSALDDLPEDRLLTVNEVAALLQCSVRNVYALLHRGDIPRPLKIGALSRWRLSALRHWLAHQCRVG